MSPLSRLAPEFRALCVATGAAALGTASEAELADALSKVQSWPDFVQGAFQHRVASIVFPKLLSVGRAGLPEEHLAALRTGMLVNAGRGLHQFSELKRLQHLFGQAGQRFIVLKGMPLSQLIYGDPLKRGVGDMDLLIDPAGFVACHDIMLGAGYRLKGSLDSAVPPEAVRQFMSDLAYLHPNGQVVELHLRLFDNHTIFEKPFAEIGRDRGEVSVMGARFATLPARLLPPYLAEHGAGHCWDRLCWLADLALLVPHDEALAEAMRTATEEGLALSVTQALALSNLCFGTRHPVPAHTIRQRIFLGLFFSGRRWLERPVRGSAAWVFAELRRRVWRIFFSGTARHAWGEVRFAILNPADWAIFPLPPRLWPLLPLLRPLGWVIRNFRKTADRS